MKHRLVAMVSLFLFAVCFFEQNTIRAEEIVPENLHSLSAVLMDADSGRVLYEKDGYKARANASTTKVLTCIIALENASGDDYVSVSANAASQPDVQLGIREGEQYYLEDLLYSLMLKSHNDSAVAIAEYIGGSEKGFAEMMNSKAREIGCKDTYFITPNGLDAVDANGTHHTTARDLAMIMRYAIKSKSFLQITQTRSYSFSDLNGKRNFTIQNTNAFLDMTDGVLSGKTGFTSDAGYCYVCACKKGDKIFVISLLGCGWPNNKTYKWTDSMKLLKYGDENYEYQTIWKEPDVPPVLVENGASDNYESGSKVWLNGHLPVTKEVKETRYLLKDDERIIMKISMEEHVAAPVKKGDRIGKTEFFLGDKLLAAYPIIAERTVEEMDYHWCLNKVFEDFFH